MEAFVKNNINTLSDVFCAWMGGIPENGHEIKDFLSKHTDLAKLLSHHDMDKKINSSPKRAEICRTYYQKHKKEISRKAKENPNTQIYKKRYKIKKRWQEKTGPAIMNLLQALALHKQSDR